MSSYKQYMLEISKYSVMSPEEEKIIFLRVASGDRKARQEAIKRNLKLVVTVIKDDYNPNLKDATMDLIQAGNVGLIKAVDNYDANKGVRFSTYAAPYIHSECCSLMHERSPLTMAQGVFWRVVKIRKINAELNKTLGRAATVEDLCKYANCTEEMAKVAISMSSISLDEELSDASGMTFKDRLCDNTDTEADIVDKLYYESLIKKLFDRLTEREKRIVKLYYGFDDNKPLTLEEIGQIPGFSKTGDTLSRERVRQILSAAIEKMRMCQYLLS